jgi:ribonuclease-3
MTNFTDFCNHINYHFKQEELLLEAMTHPSLTQESKTIRNYQRLEFLGDKVLSLVISEFLMNKFPDEMEGALSRRQSALVSGETLAEIALTINLENALLLSEGEKKLGGKTNKRNLENALEALIGAIYLDSNYESAKKFIMQFWHDFFDRDSAPPKDPVSKLQEIVQSQTKLLPEYITNQSGGLDHAPEFIAIVKIPGQDLEFSAHGKSKKEAQKEAAKSALEYLEKNPLK